MWRKGNAPSLLVGMKAGTATMENSMEVPHKTKNRIGKSRSSDRFYFLTSQNHCRWWLQPQNQKTLAPWKKSCDQPRQHIKKQKHYFADSGSFSQSYCFSTSYVWMWELDHKESWVLKNWCLWTVALKTLESPLGCKEIKPINCKGNHSWIFIHWCWSWSPNTLATWCKERILC